MKKRCVILLLVMLALQPSASAGNPIYTRLVMPLFFEYEIPADVGIVQREINRIVQEKIGASLELIPLLRLTDDVRRGAEYEMLSKQGISFDIYPNNISEETPIALDELLAKYGQGAAGLIGDLRLSVSRDDGNLYGLCSVNDFVASFAVTMRRDIIEKYDIDLSSIHTFDDLDALFQFVHEKEPTLKMICGYQTRSGLISRLKHRILVPNSFLDVSSSDPTLVVNYYATDIYKDNLTLIRKWNKLGYMPDHLIIQNIRAAQLVGTGELFAYICAHKPGIDYEESLSCGMEMVTIPLMESMITRHSVASIPWHISDACVNPGKAMQLLNLMYTDAELVNLLSYGIEGIHYVMQPDGTIDYPDGVTVETVGYANSLSWMLPNQMVSHVWRGNDPDLWEQLRVYNESAPVSDSLDFVFDQSSVATIYSRVNAIAEKYAYGLETGQLDPDIYLAQMLAEMEAAGSQLVLTEAQRQFDVYLDERNVKP